MAIWNARQAGGKALWFYPTIGAAISSQLPLAIDRILRPAAAVPAFERQIRLSISRPGWAMETREILLKAEKGTLSWERIDGGKIRFKTSMP